MGIESQNIKCEFCGAESVDEVFNHKEDCFYLKRVMLLCDMIKRDEELGLYE